MKFLQIFIFCLMLVTINCDVLRKLQPVNSFKLSPEFRAAESGFQGYQNQRRGQVTLINDVEVNAQRAIKSRNGDLPILPPHA